MWTSAHLHFTSNFSTFIDCLSKSQKTTSTCSSRKKKKTSFSFLSSNVETFLSPYVNSNFKRRSDGFFIEMGALLNKTREACKSKLQKIQKNPSYHERIWKAINYSQAEWEQLVQNNDNAFTTKRVERRCSRDPLDPEAGDPRKKIP